MITITEHEKTEWSRYAQAAYVAGRNDIGHKMSVAASLPKGAQMTVSNYDALMSSYRAWLTFNEFKPIADPVPVYTNAETTKALWANASLERYVRRNHLS